MTDVLRIAHLRIAHQGAILRWAILRVIQKVDWRREGGRDRKGG